MPCALVAFPVHSEERAYPGAKSCHPRLGPLPVTGERDQMQSTYSRVASVQDGLRWKPIHTRVTLVLGLGWMLDAFEVNIIGGVLGVLQKLWQLTTEQASLLVSVWLIGIMVGALLFGYCADRFGRRRLFVLTLLVYSGFTVR